MRRIAITNQKGGVGKTTTCANLGAALSQRGQRVLLIDLDPQAHLTTYFGLDAGAGPGAYELLTEQPSVFETLLKAEQNLTIIPSRLDLAAAENELINTPGRESVLRDRLAVLSDEFDWMLIDCPPAFNILTLNALSAVDEVLVPLQPHFLGLQGVGRLLETVSLVQQRINPSLCVRGFVLCMNESGTRLAGEVIADVRKFLDEARGQDVPWRDARLFDTRIRRNIKLAECPSYGQSIFTYAPKSHGAEDYLALADELMRLPHPAADASDGDDGEAEAAPLPHAAADQPAAARAAG